MTNALVLGGGGVTGIAWEIGVLCGLRREGIILGAADTIIGTSAGSVVGTLLAAGMDLEEAVAQQQVAVPTGARTVDMTPLLAVVAVLTDASLPPRQARARVGAMALAATTGDEDRFVRGIAASLPVQRWPERDLRITAVDTADGQDVVFDAAAGVPLTHAVAASCAVPGVLPPVTVDGRRYMDGGVRSGTNADLAAGADRLVVIAPMAAMARSRVDAEIRSTGAAHSLVIEPDDAALDAFGPNVMDASRRAESVRAGLRQGRSLAASVRRVWPG
ncbi:MAG TPA: patatin-like phospholipase family protein [Catenuloplanes sp.]|jgi:NTE family protein